MQAFLIYENYSHFTIAADLSASSVSEEQKNPCWTFIEISSP